MIRDHTKESKTQINLRKTPYAAEKQNTSGKRGYVKIPNDKREDLIKIIAEKQLTIKEAAQTLGINYSTAKNIVKIFRQEKRTSILLRNVKPSIISRSDPDPNSEETTLKRFMAKKTYLEIDKTQLATPALLIKEVSNVKILDQIRPIDFDFSIYSSLIYER